MLALSAKTDSDGHFNNGRGYLRLRRKNILTASYLKTSGDRSQEQGHAGHIKRKFTEKRAVGDGTVPKKYHLDWAWEKSNTGRLKKSKTKLTLLSIIIKETQEIGTLSASFHDLQNSHKIKGMSVT